MDILDKYKFDSIVAKLRFDLPNHSEEEKAKYIDLLDIALEEHMVAELYSIH